MFISDKQEKESVEPYSIMQFCHLKYRLHPSKAKSNELKTTNKAIFTPNKAVSSNKN